MYATITDMRERGLHTERAVLAVLDGSKALAKAVRDVYGPRALIQRCQAFRRVMGSREGMPQLVRALKDHENAVAPVASRRQTA